MTVRWVNKNYEVHEDTLGLKELSDTKATTIFKEVKDFFPCQLLNVEARPMMGLAI